MVGLFDKLQLVVVQLTVVVWWNPMANRNPPLAVIVDLRVFFVVQVRFQMRWVKSLMKRMMASFEWSVVVLAVFLPRVVVVEPVEQSVLVVVVMTMIVQLVQVVVLQFACGRLYALQ